jgi:hypothetical protein
MKRVLILLHEETHLHSMMPLIQFMKGSGRFEPVVFIAERMEAFGLLDRAGEPVSHSA